MSKINDNITVNKDANVLQQFRQANHIGYNTVEAILCSYDLRAGELTEAYNENQKKCCLLDGKREYVGIQQLKQSNAEEISDIIKRLGVKSLLDVGTGEATTLGPLIRALSCEPFEYFATEISLSRILYAQTFLKQFDMQSVNLSVADLFTLPFNDSTIDIVTTFSAIDSNTEKTRAAIEELYRVCSKYLLLVEPAFDLGNEETKSRISEHKTITDLHTQIQALNLNVLEHRLLKASAFNFNLALTLIEKKNSSDNEPFHGSRLACANCGESIEHYNDGWYCRKCGLLYPIVMGVPVFLPKSAILCSKYEEFVKDEVSGIACP